MSPSRLDVRQRSKAILTVPGNHEQPPDAIDDWRKATNASVTTRPRLGKLCCDRLATCPRFRSSICW